MMYRFPKDLYADVRIEDVAETAIDFENGVLTKNQSTREKGAFLRIYDGRRWYYSAVTDLDSIQAELDALAAMAQPNPALADDPVVRRFEVNRDTCLRYAQEDVRKISPAEKQALLEQYLPLLRAFPACTKSRASYQDTYTEKWFYSSLGADLHFDYQRASLILRYTFSAGASPFSNQQHLYAQTFSALSGRQEHFRSKLEADLAYAEQAVPVRPGDYPCVLAPNVAGVFAHESFGHKSEADLMLGSEAMRREWTIGAKVGSDLLNIIDSGLPEGSGYVPYDDEGTRAKQTYLIRDGILAGRLHSAATAAALDEAVTGNARATTFEFEPIVRMTSTYIGAGEQTLEQLLAPIEEGIFVPDFRHGSGMSTFTIAPATAYMIRGGKLAEPVQISVLTGSVMQTLHEIDGLSNEAEICSMSSGGCGKMEQYPLRVAFGGPYVRVKSIHVQ